MKLIFIRHGDPDYSIDSLTEKGWKEAHLLSERMKNVKAKRCFVSPLGRAKDTAKESLEKMNMEGEILDFLEEFPVRVHRPDRPNELKVSWDWLPEDWTKNDKFFSPDTWMEHEVFDEANIKERVDYINSSFESLLNELGYKKEGRLFKAVKANNDTYVFFCHFALQCVLLAYLLNASPMVLWHGLCAAPTSVTTVVTEERREGTAYFRMSSFGDISHLYVANEPPAFAARFCECFTNEDERHD